jgi:hypothetical protein
MAICIHNSTIPDSFIDGLHYNQAGYARHKCPNCAYQVALTIGGEAGNQEGFDSLFEEIQKETCQHGNTAPVSLISQWYYSQGGAGRHKCAICAFADGLRHAFSHSRPPQTTQPANLHTIPFPVIGYSNRDQFRRAVIDLFFQEAPGTGRGPNSSKYYYIVEDIQSLGRITLRRPAFLHYGFDFLVCLDGHNFNPNGRFRDYPSHPDIIQDLELKLNENPANYRIIFNVLEQIFNCSVSNILQLPTAAFSTGLHPRIIYGLMKWLFVEQDIRYWNYSGRNSLWSGIPRP